MPWLDTGTESGISRPQICPGWIQVSNLEFFVYRYALAGYRYRIYNQSLTDMPWLDTGIESGIVTVDSNYLWIDLFLKR